MSVFGCCSSLFSLTNIPTLLAPLLLLRSLCSRVSVCNSPPLLILLLSDILLTPWPPSTVSHNGVRPGLFTFQNCSRLKNEISYQVWAAWAKAPRIWGLHVNEGILSKQLHQSKSLCLCWQPSCNTVTVHAWIRSVMCLSYFRKSFVVYNWKRSRKVLPEGDSF